ncbi:MAG: hypothetical protein NTU98_01460 [Bacteroidetes bacterium]|nr:hypothetical protein [Bacteroidota bacterium]
METTGTTNRIMEIQDQRIELQGATLLHLNEIRKWTNFLSILGFIAFGLLILVGIIMLFAFSVASSYAFSPYAAVMGPWMGIIYIIFSAIYFFPIYYLFRFSTLTKQSLLQINLGGGNSNALMAQAIDYLKRHFRFVGIFTIVVLSMYILIIIGVVIMLAMR